MIDQESISDDNRAVSPVIGVILMVAITVILAAVIGTFVLGLGDSLNQAPQAQLDASVAGNAGSESLEISHNGGDGIPASEIRVVVGGTSVDGDASAVSISGSDSTLNVGETLSIAEGDAGSPSGDTQIRLVHTPSESILLDTEVTFS